MPKKMQKTATKESITDNRIEIERRRLQRARAVLECLSIAHDAGHDIDYSDVADVAHNLVDLAIDNLDSVKLKAGKVT